MKRYVLLVLMALVAAPCFAGTRDLKEDTATIVPVGPFVDSTGAAVTAPTIASIDITAYKNDGTAVTITPAASGTSNDMVHVDDGYFSLELTATDTSTPGYLRLSFQISGALIFHEDFNVLPANIYDSKYSTDLLQVDTREVTGTAQTAKDIGAAVPAAAAGASGGLLISGSNSGTTTLGALTVTGATTYTGATVHTGAVSYANGIAITQATSNGIGVAITGNGTGPGLSVSSGSGATGDALYIQSLATNGNGMAILGNGSGDGIASGGGATGDGVQFFGGASSGHGLHASAGSGDGIHAIASTGDGIEATATTGSGIKATASSSGDGMTLQAAGTSKHGLSATGGTAGTSDGIKAVAGTGGVDIRGNITGNITGTLSTVTTLTNLPAITSNWLTAAGTASDFTTEVLAPLISDAQTEPTGAPASNETIAEKIGFLFATMRNKVTVTSSEKTVYDDSDSEQWDKELSDDTTTYTETEANTAD